MSKNNAKSHCAIRKGNQLPVNVRMNENNGKTTDQFEQRVSLCHIGLVKDHGGHLVNQPRLSIFEKIC